MIAVFLAYGLAFFGLGLAVTLEARRASVLPLGKQLPWLAGFALTHSLVEWSDMLLLAGAADPWALVLMIARTSLLPLSALLLIRFGVGIINEAGPLPRRSLLIPVSLIVPAAVLVAYALTEAAADPTVAVDVWSRYLFYFTGSALSAFGFVRQWRVLARAGLSEARGLMLGAAVAFSLNAIVAGLVVPAAPYGLGPWLNYDNVLRVTGLPVQIWRLLSAVGVTFFVIRALDVFEAERRLRLEKLRHERRQAEEVLRQKEEQFHSARLRAQTEAREAAEEWAAGLVEISRRIANMEGVDGVLLQIVRQAKELLKASTVSLGLLDESGQQLELKCQAAAGPAYILDRPLAVESSPLLEHLGTGRAARFPSESRPQDRAWHCPTVAGLLHSAVVVPLQFDGRLVGGLWAGRLEPRPFSDDDVAELESFADQAVIALQHALMASRLQSLAVTEERSRIAREMHDSLAQILGYLGLQTQTLEALLRQGRNDEVLSELRQTRANVETAQADVRENILSLRTTLAGESGILSALEEYICEFGVQTGQETQIASRLEKAPNLSPLAEVQLVRIVQEALANVRKHARAENVRVSLSSRDGCLHVSVADDGRGFELVEDRGQFGLQTMRERAESVGGGLRIVSHLGEGTEVQLWMPLLPE